jgi:hypothetical protein
LQRFYGVTEVAPFQDEGFVVNLKGADPDGIGAFISIENEAKNPGLRYSFASGCVA